MSDPHRFRQSGLVTSLVVTNSFGEKLLLRHTTAVDGVPPAWRMFGLLPTQQADSKFLDAFFLAPAISLSLEAAPVEAVSLLRDEMASLAWAIERTVESPSGQRLDRHEEFAQRQQGQSATPGVGGSQPAAPAKLVYRLGSSVPDYWIPFVPVRLGQSVELRRGSLPGAGLEPKGRLFDPRNELLLHDEEIPREGAQLTRSCRYARWADGSSHLWVGRRKRPGRGEGSSGLRFDILDSGPSAGCFAPENPVRSTGMKRPNDTRRRRESANQQSCLSPKRHPPPKARWLLAVNAEHAYAN